MRSTSGLALALSPAAMAWRACAAKRVAHLVETARRDRVGLVRVQHSPIQRAGAVVAIEFPGGEGLLCLVDKRFRAALRVARLRQPLRDALHVVATTEQFAGDVKRGFRVVELARVQRRVRSCDFRLSHTAQAIAGRVAVGLLVARLLEEFAGAVAIATVEVSSSSAWLAWASVSLSSVAGTMLRSLSCCSHSAVAAPIRTSTSTRISQPRLRGRRGGKEAVGRRAGAVRRRRYAASHRRPAAPVRRGRRGGPAWARCDRAIRGRYCLCVRSWQGIFHRGVAA